MCFFCLFTLLFHRIHILCFLKKAETGGNSRSLLFSFLQVINGDKTLGENIALDIQDELFLISSSQLDKIRTHSVVTSDRNEVWFLLPNEDSKYSIIMIYDYFFDMIKQKFGIQRCNYQAIIWTDRGDDPSHSNICKDLSYQRSRRGSVNTV